MRIVAELGSDAGPKLPPITFAPENVPLRVPVVVRSAYLVPNV